MIAFGIAVFVTVGVLVLAFRGKLAEMQSLLAGGRVPVGCVVMEGAGFFALALVVFLLRESLR